jgi:hypothetical protein
MRRVEDGIAIVLQESAGISRRREPVTLGVPIPIGSTHDDHLVMVDELGAPVPLQTQTLRRWPDHSVQWVLCDWQVDLEPHERKVVRLLWPDQMAPVDQPAFSIDELNGSWRIDTGKLLAILHRHNLRLEAPVAENKQPFQDQPHLDLLLTEENATVQRARVVNSFWETRGPIRATANLEAEFRDARRNLLALVFLRIHFFSGLSRVRIDVTLRNPRAAHHVGGLWDLGDPGSLLFLDLSLHWRTVASSRFNISWTESLGGSTFESANPIEIYQDSSGGTNWRSRNHVNQQCVTSSRFPGYCAIIDGKHIRYGLRASPVMLMQTGRFKIGTAVREFWQNFPKVLDLAADGLRVGLFPHEFPDIFELQGGEQKTHTIFFDFLGGEDTLISLAGLAHSPLVPAIDPEVFAWAGAFPYLKPDSAASDDVHRRIVDTIVEPGNSFQERREIIDEYGWRNFGDIYADHESAERQDGQPTIAHYNNQYDIIKGSLYRWAASSDPRWFRLMDELARHVIDIDIYHTDQDEPKYNGGLFWHTDHYTDAETATHRTYSRRNAATGSALDYGGGPSSEHNYTTGLLYYYYLTGNPLVRESVVGLADWVIAMDAGRRNRFGWFDRRPTGLASATASRFYHGPGRGAGNSINALIDGHILTGEHRYLEKAEQLIRRCIHPRDDVARRDLLNPEQRWSYLVFLQVLGRYLEYKREMGQKDKMFSYARLSLLRYADWMHANEQPYKQLLHKVKKPTESWPAHDIQKGDVFCLAALHADSEEKRSRYIERAVYFYQTCLTDLQSFASWTLTRPLVILLTNGWHWSSIDEIATAPIEPMRTTASIPAPEHFRPQLYEIQKLRSLLHR